MQSKGQQKQGPDFQNLVSISIILVIRGSNVIGIYMYLKMEHERESLCGIN